MARGLRQLLLAAALLIPARASLAEPLLGFQVAATQSMGTSFTDSPQLLLLTSSVGRPLDQVARLTGLQLATTLNANATLDFLSQSADHGFLAGVALTQRLPALVPDTVQAALRDKTLGLSANGNYLGRVHHATWAFAFGGGVSVIGNGSLSSVNGAQSGALNGTLPGQSFGFFVLNGQTVTAQARTDLQLTHAAWDLDFLTRYAYTQNGLFTLAPGAPGALPAVGAGGSALGTFIPATSHTFGPSLRYRGRLSPRAVFLGDVNINATFPVRQTAPIVVKSGTVTADIPATNPLPKTLVGTALASYTYLMNESQTLGVDASATGSLRAPNDLTDTLIDASGRPVGLRPDALILQAHGLYGDRLLRDVLINLAIGVAQARIFQPPLGALPSDPRQPRLFIPYTPARSSEVEPVGTVSLTRRFDPIDATFFAGKTIGVGALGASAVTSLSAGLAFRHIARIAKNRLLTTNLGFTIARNRATGRFASAADLRNPLSSASDNDSAGITATLGMPLYVDGPFRVLGNFVYAYSFNDLDPLHRQPKITAPMELGQPPSQTHAVLFTFTALFGRGSLQSDTGAIPDPFARNPRTGTPLASSALLQPSEAVLDGNAGRAPGVPATFSSEDAYRQSVQQQNTEAESRLRGGANVGSVPVPTTVQEEDLGKEENERREARRSSRTRTFGEWPMELAVPKGPSSEKPEKKPEPTPAPAPESKTDKTDKTDKAEPAKTPDKDKDKDKTKAKAKAKAKPGKAKPKHPETP